MLTIEIYTVVILAVLLPAIVISLIFSKRYTNKYFKLREDLVSSHKTINYHLLIQSLLLNLTRSMTLTVNQKELLNQMIEITKKLFNPDVVSIMLADEKKDYLNMIAHSGLENSNIDQKVKIGDKISGFVAKSKKPLLIINGKLDFSLQKIPVRENVRSSMCVPLIVEKELLGVINISITRAARNFTKRDLQIFETFSNEIALAIKNYKLINNIKRNFIQTLTSFAASIDAKDKYTKNHSQNVSNIAGLIAKSYGFDNKKVSQLIIAGLLHDIGKIGIPDEILNKNGRLNSEQLKVVRKHPIISTNILGKIDQFEPIIPAILYHHERWDGGGYPYGLKGEEIPVEARILAIADAYDAIITDRPYRKALNKKEALAEISKNAGTQFDPDLVKIFLKII